MNFSRLQRALFGTSRHDRDRNRAALSSLLSLAWVVEARDPYTGGHLWRVARYSNLVARQAGLQQRDVASITVGAFLHDLGKVAIPDAVLRKAGPLTDEEYSVIKTHPTIGTELLMRHPLGELVADAVYEHHERPDGKGYPRRLHGDQISRKAGIVGICDAFDAMTSARPYRAPMQKQRAFSIIREGLGSQFDAHFGSLFLQLEADDRLAHIVGHSDDGIPLRECLACGPTVVVRRETVESTVFCPVCRTGYNLTGASQPLTPSNIQATAEDLQPRPDGHVINAVLDAAQLLF
ncbi:HD-GYP domain-containing protein [Paraburkholderia caribensis]|nr:HD-GYP domain-containing protein [Paraburkholderia caribensis]